MKADPTRQESALAADAWQGQTRQDFPAGEDHKGYDRARRVIRALAARAVLLHLAGETEPALVVNARVDALAADTGLTSASVNAWLNALRAGGRLSHIRQPESATGQRVLRLVSVVA